MASEWYYTVRGQQAPAPITPAALKQLAASGQLQPGDLVWQEGMANWTPAGSVKGLFKPGSGELPTAGEKTPTPKPRTRKTVVEEPSPKSDAILDLHPVLVLLLAACTAGLFALFYAWRACRDISRAPRRAQDAAGRPLGRLRHPVAVLLLSWLTLGIYFAYWASRVMAECNAFTGRKGPRPRTELTLMLLFPPYAVYTVVFRLPELIRTVQQHARQPEMPAGACTLVFLNPCLFFALPLLAVAEQEALNQVWQAVP
jgi:hypothetical protein